MRYFAGRCPPISELRDYSYWIGATPLDVRRAVIAHGGAITPLSAFVVMVEVVVGYVMLGILISILAAKVARRS